MRRLISFFALLGMVGMMACSSGVVRTPDRDRDRDADSGTSGSSINEAFDPVKLNDEDLTFPEKDLQLSGTRPLPLPGDRQNSDRQNNNNVTPPPGPAEENRVIDGFRVQLFATKDNQAATLEKQEAEFVFSPDGVGVYIEFDSPMYKLRIGDCRTRDEAEELRELARQKGYPTSWIVKTKINTSPALPAMNNSDSGNSDNDH